jgi:titin
MAISWGTWRYGNIGQASENGMRVGIEVTWATPTHTSSAVSASIDIWTENQFKHTGDTQTLTYSANLGAATNYTNNEGTGTQTRRFNNKTYTHTYAADSYHTSPGNVVFTAELTGHYWDDGTNPTVSVTSAIPARPATIPNAPTGLSATASTTVAGRIDLSWTASTDDGGITTNYRIYRDGSALTTRSATTYADTGLANNTAYSYAIEAYNAVGNSTSKSSAASATTMTTPTVDVTASAGIRSVTASYTTTNGRGTITSVDLYLYDYAVGDYRAPENKTTATGSHTWTGLANGGAYFVGAYSYNAAGNSAFDTTGTLYVPTVPNTPSVSVTPLNASISVTYSTPYDGGSSITGYQYQVNSTAGAWTAAPASPFTITGLTNGTSYTVYVRAVNDVGAGTPGSASTTPRAVPSAPTVSLVRGSGSVTVTWSAGSNGGSTILATYYRVNGGTLIAAPASPFTITNLTNGTPVTVTMYQTNAAGEGATGTSNTVTPFGIPFAPTINSITPTVNSLSVAFTPGSNNGDNITNYKYSVNGGSTFTTRSPAAATSPLVIPGLSPNTSYGVQIRAINAAGDGTQTATTAATTLGGRVGISDGNGNWKSVQIAKHTGNQWEPVPSVLVYISNGDNTWHLANG